VRVNSSPRTVAELNDLPIKRVGLSTVYLRDVANVRDGFPPQTNIVRQDARRGALMRVLKAGNASTIDVVKGIRRLLRTFGIQNICGEQIIDGENLESLEAEGTAFPNARHRQRKKGIAGTYARSGIYTGFT
jgi:hypothetical protein